MNELHKKRIQKALIDTTEATDVKKYMLLSMDSQGRASVQFNGTTLQENAFLLLMGQDVIRRIAIGELKM